jgi:hypothetical protein
LRGGPDTTERDSQYRCNLSKQDSCRHEPALRIDFLRTCHYGTACMKFRFEALYYTPMLA